MRFNNIRQVLIGFAAITFLAFGLSTECYAQAKGNPFARPVPVAPTPAPTSPAPQQVAAPPVPAIPPKLFEQDDDEIRKTFEDLQLVATAGMQAVLKSGDVVYYLRDGEYFSYDGNKVRVKVDGSRVFMYTQKDNEEVFASEIGNGVVPSKSPIAKARKESSALSAIKELDNKTAEATSGAASSSAVPGIKK